MPALLLLPPGALPGRGPPALAAASAAFLAPPPGQPHSLARESVHFPQDPNQHSGAGRGPRKQDALEARWLTARRTKAAPS